MHDGWIYGMGWFWLMVLLVAGAAVWLVVRSVRRDRSGRAAPPRERSSEDLLGTRFARGEIDEQEFRRRRKALREED